MSKKWDDEEYGKRPRQLSWLCLLRLDSGLAAKGDQNGEKFGALDGLSSESTGLISESATIHAESFLVTSQKAVSGP